MKKIIIMSLGAGALLFTSCNQEQASTTAEPIAKTENTTRKDFETKSSEEAEAVTPDSVYRTQAIVVTEKMASDLELDTEAKAIAEEIFFNRAKRRATVQNEFADNEYRLNKEMQTIEEETDQQVLSILTYSQSREYVQNRESYDDGDYELQNSATDQSGGMSGEKDKPSDSPASATKTR